MEFDDREIFWIAYYQNFNKKYGVSDKGVLLFAMGDGNHSLATAKTCYENLKKTIELRFLNNPPMASLFDFDYNYYMKGLVSDEVYNQKKKDFENKFLEFYYFDEIGYKTPDRFKQRLKNYLDMGFKVWQGL